MAQQKQTVVSFRVDQHLAEILNTLPDKSDFIREAILQRIHTACPCCQGRGVLPKAIAEWVAAKLPDFDAVECSCCHYQYPTELVRATRGRDDTFVCPHCADHNHRH
jgi:hypothetical protein